MSTLATHPPALLRNLGHDRLLPLAVLRTAGDAIRVADEVVAAGKSTLEIALRSSAGLPGLRSIADRPDLLVGAGTVTSVDQVDAVVEAGASFVVTPGFHAPVVERCLAHGIPVLPGIATAGEMMSALSLGIDTVKLFPAQALGGVSYVDALAGPFPQVRVVASGGITSELTPAYLRRPTVLAVSRSWSTP